MSGAQADAPAGKTQALRGTIGVAELALIVLAWSAPIVTVGGVSGIIVRYAGAGAPLAFAIAMAILMLFAIGYVTMSRYVENPGAFYAYITAGLGKPMGLGAGFLAIAGYFLLAMGTTAIFGFSTKALVEQVFGGPVVAWSVYAFASVLLVAVLGYFRIDLSAKLLSAAMICEVVLIAVFDAAVFAKGGATGISVQSFTWDAFNSGSMSLGVLLAATCFSGFEATAIFREEAKDPRRTVARATYLAVASIGIIYVVSTWALILAFGTGAASAMAARDAGGMFPIAVQRFVGLWASDGVTVLRALSAFAALLSVQNILSRYIYSLAVDAVLPGLLANVHPRHGSPHVSSIVISSLMLMTLLPLAASEDVVQLYGQLLGAGGLAVLALIALTGVAIITFFVRRTDISESWLRTLLAPVLSTMGMGFVLVLAVQNLTLLTGGSLSGAIALQAGLAGVFVAGVTLALHFRARHPAIYLRIGRQAA
jgi:amino acid transporter